MSVPGGRFLLMEKERVRRVLWTVACAREPITAATIASLANLTERQVSSALQSLRSVVHVPEDSSLISTLHASFPEYMLDDQRSKGLYCDESKSNETLVQRCFDIMKSELRFNICQLENSYLADDQVNDLEARVVRCISPTLSYACRYWSSHLRLSSAKDNTSKMLLDFLFERFLFWMEVLSLIRCIGIGATMIQQAQTWLRMDDNSDEVQKQVSDARNFVTWFAANLCSRSTPHIYISALPLCAKSSWVYQTYFQRTTGLASISISQHEEAVLAIWSLHLLVYSLAISPDGNCIASSCHNGSVFVYDIHTGAVVVVGPFQGHTGSVWSVVFSPDGRHIASGSTDQTAIVWDAQTGRIVTGPLHKHTDKVWSVTFSPDGRRLVSGSNDKTIIVWDTYTGVIALGPLKGHSDEIYSVAFSPDGQLIASCSVDQTIRLWDASTGAAFAEPLRGHTDQVRMVAFSPDESRLASCSYDRTIRVWDIKSGTTIGSPFTGHTDSVWSIAFSHDGRWIASGGLNTDNNIIVWDTHTGSVVLGPLSGHTSDVNSVAFTPDNTRIVSSSDDRTIRIWDVQPQNKDPGQSSARESSVGPVAFLHNHTQLISCTSAGLPKVWDMRTGTTIPREFEGQAEAAMIHSITVSPQDTLVAVGANDITIRVWNVHTGKLVWHLVTGHNSPIRCLRFSPDGAQLCSGADDATVAVWDIDSAMVSRSYTGHTDAVISVAFSPDATRIASSSADCTIRIWDKSTGALIHKLDGHESSVSSVAFSPDGSFIVSGSTDGVIRQWDAKAGTLINPISPIHSDTDFYSRSGSDGISLIHCACFSPDGTQIISGFGSSLRLVDAYTMNLISKMSLPRGEIVRWVGYSPDGMDIISISTSDGAGTLENSEEPVRQSAQNPNIIRVWRANVRPDQMSSSSTPRDWSYEKDGRVISPEGLVMWIPPDLIPHMRALIELGSESHYSSFVMSSDKFINIGYRDLCIGNRWAECYVLKN
ncbi:putative vegetative incompatibility protein HET-E-1 [Rhizoctonia solani 123E]|uniref:Putative vegetative incompatibility protein HET-E-1 n=1 Tax=Rhizoctonia solani 123E TaxID=1423351 RepID=A0A074S6H3_9AGAM|nr:putative vegetative incompatibility protein HET-E-1 [Rhizoctonia solani 123E]